MISFYPGPSRVHDELPRYVKEAHVQGIMSINHRSPTFVAMSKRTIGLLKSKLRIPAAYTVFFTSSATECWEIIAQSLINGNSYHYYNGAFGQKWYEYTHRLQKGAIALPFGSEAIPDTGKINDATDAALICITQNETSNGTQVSNAALRNIRKNNSCLIAVDATSSMAGIALDFKAADVWFASVQKCFGLPAGLGIMVCSPQAMARVRDVNARRHYNSLAFMSDMMEKWQTPFTPNVLGIYLLMRVMENAPPIRETEALLAARHADWIAFLEKRKSIRPLIRTKTVQSLTVIPVAGDPVILEKIKKDAKRQGILLGEGYGEFKTSTFRIANFPALRAREIATLKKCLTRY